MPASNLLCQDCRSLFEKVIPYSDYGKQPVICPVCRSANHRLKINRVRVARSKESRINTMESWGDIQNLSRLEDNPQALGCMMRKMSSEIGESMGDEFNDVVDRLEKGHDPKEIEKYLPELWGE